MLTLSEKINHIKRRVFSRVKYAINPQLIYGEDSFYDDTRKHKDASIRAAAQLILETFSPQSVADIGCGEGLFLRTLAEQGVKVIGCDISEAAIRLAPDTFTVFQADATKPIRFNHRFDVCICVEIAEHIPNRYSKTLVQNVTSASDVAFFTAAPPWQGGVGHINEQPAEFWVRLFAEEGYELDQATTDTLKQRMKEANVVFWLPQNLMIFRKKAAL